MNKAMQYIENALAGIPESRDFYNFRKLLVDEVTERANEITHAGIRDENVLSDLIISEHPDVREEYETYVKRIKQKRRRKLTRQVNIFGTVFCTILILCIYFFVSVKYGAWNRSWLVLITGFGLWGAYLMSNAVVYLGHRKRFVYCASARLILGLEVMILAVCTFLVSRFGFGIAGGWLAVLAGVIVALGADAVFASVSKQKFAFINYMLYIPPVAALLYVMCGCSGLVPWNLGWVMIPAALLVDVAIAFGLFMHNARQSSGKEVDDVWSES